MKKKYILGKKLYYCQTFFLCQKYTNSQAFPVWLRNQLMSTELELVNKTTISFLVFILKSAEICLSCAKNNYS